MKKVFNVFKQVPKLIFGINSIKRIDELIPEFDKKSEYVLIVYDIYFKDNFPELLKDYDKAIIFFDSKKSETDKLFEHNEIKLLVDEKSYLYLVGTTLNYSGGLNGKGFVFENPNASRTCGCGESFAL